MCEYSAYRRVVVYHGYTGFETFIARKGEPPVFYERTTLPDGTTVLSETMGTVRSVALGIWVRVGSRDEAHADAGMSHFLEHMMFKGTPTRSAADISGTFDQLGAELNAFTSKEYTCYYARVLDEHLPTAIEVLSDMVCESLMESDAIKHEREVVLEEIARSEDAPDDKVHDLFSSSLWPTHPLGRPVLGRTDSVGSFDTNASFAFKKEHYVTGNVVVTAAGNVSHEQLVALSGAHLHLPQGPQRTRSHEFPTVESRLHVLERPTEQAHICYGVSGLNAGHDDRFALSILDSILGGGMSSRLFQEIREKKGLAYAVYSYHALYEDTGQFTVYAGTRPSNAEQVVRLIQAQMTSLAESGPTAEELHRAKESLKGSLVLGLESTRNRMTRLGKSEITHGEILSIDTLVERIEAVEAADIERLAGGLFEAERVLAVVGPFAVEDLSHLVS